MFANKRQDIFIFEIRRILAKRPHARGAIVRHAARGRGRGRRPRCKRIAASLAPRRSSSRPKPARLPPRVRVAFFYSDHRPRPTRRAVRTSELHHKRRARGGTRPTIIAYDALFLSFFFASLSPSVLSLLRPYSSPLSPSVPLPPPPPPPPSLPLPASLISTGAVPLLREARTYDAYRNSQKGYAKIVLIRGNASPVPKGNFTLRPNSRCSRPEDIFVSNFVKLLFPFMSFE